MTLKTERHPDNLWKYSFIKTNVQVSWIIDASWHSCGMYYYIQKYHPFFSKDCHFGRPQFAFITDLLNDLNNDLGMQLIFCFQKQHQKWTECANVCSTDRRVCFRGWFAFAPLFVKRWTLVLLLATECCFLKLRRNSEKAGKKLVSFFMPLQLCLKII